jgi:cell division GTPase FtsZ
VVDALRRDSDARPSPYLAAARALDTDAAALDRLRSIPEAHRDTFGLAETGGDGTGGDRTAGVGAFEDDRLAARRAVDDAITADVDAILLVAGVAGGTGSGATPHLLAALDEIYERPIYAAAVLPADPDPSGAETTVRGLSALDSVADATVLLDNARWIDGSDAPDGRVDEVNRTYARRIGALCAAGEVDADAGGAVGESVVDASEIVATLEADGYAALGHSARELDTDDDGGSLVDRVRSGLLGGEPDVDEVAAIRAIETTLREATKGTVTVECSLSDARRGLLVVAGPPAWLVRDGVMDGRSWLESRLAAPQLRGGDVPMPGRSTLAVTVLLAGLDEPPRIAELAAVAAE